MADKAEKVTFMRLKVDLQCSKCVKKVKKVLRKIPQVRAQAFDEKQNIVTITVVCCSPEKIRDKICYKSGGAVKSIEIVEPSKKPEGGGNKKKDEEKTKAESDKSKSDGGKAKSGGEEDKKKDGGDKPKGSGGGDKPKGGGGDKPAESKPKSPGPVPVQPPVAPPPVAVPAGMVVTPYPCGPYYYGYGQPTVVYDGYCGRPVYDSYGTGGRPVYGVRCDQYFNEENPQGCSIM